MIEHRHMLYGTIIIVTVTVRSRGIIPSNHNGLPLLDARQGLVGWMLYQVLCGACYGSNLGCLLVSVVALFLDIVVWNDVHGGI